MKFKIFFALLTLCYTGLVIAEEGSSSQKDSIDSSDQKRSDSSSSSKKSQKKSKKRNELGNLILDSQGNAMILSKKNPSESEMNFYIQATLDKLQKKEDSPLIKAIKNNNLNKVRGLIEKKGKTKQEDINKALIEAVRLEHREIVEYLVEECHADVNDLMTEELITPLMAAANIGNLDMVKYLVEKCDVDIDKEDYTHNTALWFAATRGHLNVVKYLIDKGANINHINEDGETILGGAVFSNDLETVKYLIEEHNMDIHIKNKHNYDVLDMAKEFERDNVLPYLQKKFMLSKIKTRLESNQNAKNQKPIELPVSSAKTYKKAIVNESDYSLKLQQLFRGIRKSNIDEVKKQVEENPELINKKDENGSTPLIMGTFEGSLELVKFFIEKKANIEDRDINGNTALIYAAKKGYTKIAEVLLYGLQEQKSKKVESYIMSRNEKTETALSLAMVNGKQDIIDLFLPYLSTKTKEKVILLATENDSWDIVENILNNESDIDIRDIRDDYGNNLLILVAGEGNYELVKKLLDSSKININARNTEGYTALMRAVFGEYKNIVELLLKQQGIKLSAKNNYDRTVFDLAKSIGNEEILALLEPYQKKDTEQSESISAIEQKQTYTMEFLKSGLSEMNKASFSDVIEKKIHRILYILSIDPSSVIYESLRNNFGTVKGWQGYQIKAYSAKTSKKGRLSFAIATHLKTKKQKILVIEAIDEHYAFMKNYKSLGDFLTKNKDNFVSYVPKKQV